MSALASRWPAAGLVARGWRRLPRRLPRRALVAAGIGGGLAALPALQPVAGRLGSALVLLLVLPPLAAALAALGWRDRAARRLLRIERPGARVLAGYAAWAIGSALLGLDIGVLLGASVAMALGGPGTPARRGQLAAAIVGANVGSLLFPFSNLTNLVLVAGAGLGFGAYVAVAAPAQLAAGVVAAALLLRAEGRRGSGVDDAPPDGEAGSPATAPADAATGTSARDDARPAALAGMAALAGALAAIVLGFAGGDPVVPLALAAGTATAVAVASGALRSAEVVASWPRAGLAMVVAAAVLAGPLASFAAGLPQPGTGAAAIVVAAIAGTAVAAVANNLPAALAGSLWLGGAGAPVVVGYLVGTNIGALLTPHGSVATMLARSLAAADGEALAAGAYLRRAWRYALPAAVAAVAAIVATTR